MHVCLELRFMRLLLKFNLLNGVEHFVSCADCQSFGLRRLAAVTFVCSASGAAPNVVSSRWLAERMAVDWNLLTFRRRPVRPNVGNQRGGYGVRWLDSLGLDFQGFLMMVRGIYDFVYSRCVVLVVEYCMSMDTAVSVPSAAIRNRLCCVNRSCPAVL